MATQFSGGTYVFTTFTGGTRAAIMSNIISSLVTAGWTVRPSAAGLGNGSVANVTITIASPGVVTMTSHGFLGGEQVLLSTTGALPTGLSVNTVYFIKFIDANTFNLATTLGGSNINTSGTQSGTHTLNPQEMQVTPASQANLTNAASVRIADNTTNQVLVFGLQNAARTVTGSVGGANSGGVLIPGVSQTFVMYATQYHFFCCYQGAASAGRQTLHAGVLYIPSPLATVTDHGFMISNAIAANTSGAGNSFRTNPQLNTSSVGNQQFIWNANILDVNGGAGANSGCFNTILPNTAASSNYRWANDNINAADVLLACGLTGSGDEGKIKGQFFDAVYIADAFTVDATDTFSSHNWWNVTSNNTGAPRGGIWLATS